MWNKNYPKVFAARAIPEWRSIVSDLENNYAKSQWLKYELENKLSKYVGCRIIDKTISNIYWDVYSILQQLLYELNSRCHPRNLFEVVVGWNDVVINFFPSQDFLLDEIIETAVGKTFKLNEVKMSKLNGEINGECNIVKPNVKEQWPRKLTQDDNGFFISENGLYFVMLVGERHSSNARWSIYEAATKQLVTYDGSSLQYIKFYPAKVTVTELE